MEEYWETTIKIRRKSGEILLECFEGRKPSGETVVRWNLGNARLPSPPCSWELVKLQVQADPSSGHQGAPPARQDTPFPSPAGALYSERPPGMEGPSYILRSHCQEVSPEI